MAFLQLKHTHTAPEEEQISKTELRLTDIAECLDEDWVPLASLLNISPDDVSRIQSQYNYVPEQVGDSYNSSLLRHIILF